MNQNMLIHVMKKIQDVLITPHFYCEKNVS
jgi:hypothetical protein